MSVNSKRSLDATGKKVLTLLQEDARLPFSEIGRRVGLSTPAVIERVQRMEEAGIIRGYHAEVNPQELGYTLTAYVRLHTTPERYPAVLALVERIPQVLECAHVTGEESFIMKVVLKSVTHLEEIIRPIQSVRKDVHFNCALYAGHGACVRMPCRERMMPNPALNPFYDLFNLAVFASIGRAGYHPSRSVFGPGK